MLLAAQTVLTAVSRHTTCRPRNTGNTKDISKGCWCWCWCCDACCAALCAAAAAAAAAEAHHMPTPRSAPLSITSRMGQCLEGADTAAAGIRVTQCLSKAQSSAGSWVAKHAALAACAQPSRPLLVAQSMFVHPVRTANTHEGSISGDTTRFLEASTKSTVSSPLLHSSTICAAVHAGQGQQRASWPVCTG